MDDYCEITFEGTGGGTYYIPCDRVGDINAEGINLGSSTITGYSTIYGSNYDRRITFPSLAKPRYYSAYNASAVIINDMSNIQFNDRSQFYKRYGQETFYSVLLIVLAMNLLVNFFLKRR